jgi:hypothetical protein
MWGRRSPNRTVSCIACSESLPRSEAREYDKYGDRWDRDGKQFEYLCKPCFRELCHWRRDQLESVLVEIDAGTLPTEEFLARYLDAVERRHGQPES